MDVESKSFHFLLDQRKKDIRPSLDFLQTALEKHYFIQVRTPDEANQQLYLLNQKAIELRQALQALATTGTLEETLRNTPRMLSTIALNSDRKTIARYGERKAYKVLFTALENSAMHAMWGKAIQDDVQYIPDEVTRIIDGTVNKAELFLKWQLLSDLPELEGKQNPFATIMDMVTLGAVNVRMVRDELKADMPLVLSNGERVLGCFSEGQNELKYSHIWSARCSQNQFQQSL